MTTSLYKKVKYIKIDDTKYKINTDFRVAIRCFELIEDNSISDLERAYGIVTLLFGIDCPVNETSLGLAKKYLEYGNDNDSTNRERDIDYNLDQKYIIPSIRKDYHIDITSEKIHWHSFVDMIMGLSQFSLLNSVRDIRNTDLSKIKDRKEREEKAKLKKKFALPKKQTEEQKKILEEFERRLNNG